MIARKINVAESEWRDSTPSFASFIEGAWRPSASAKRIPVIDPSTEAVLARVADASVADATALARGLRVSERQAPRIHIGNRHRHQLRLAGTRCGRVAGDLADNCTRSSKADGGVWRVVK